MANGDTGGWLPTPGYGWYGSPQPDGWQSPARGPFAGRGPKSYRRPDQRMLEDLSDRLTMHPDIDASEVEVRVENGVVTLSGVVENRHEKRIAEEIAEDVFGVDDVRNELKVRHGLLAALRGERASHDAAR